MLYEKILDTLTSQGFKNAFGVIVDSNIDSVKLHESFGFTQVGHFDKVGFKNDEWHGVVWMQKNLQIALEGRLRLFLSKK